MIICRNELRSKTRGLRKDSEPNESIILPHYTMKMPVTVFFSTRNSSLLLQDIVGGGGGRGRKKGWW